MKRAKNDSPNGAAPRIRRRSAAARLERLDAVEVARRAAVYCVLHFPTLWTATLPTWDPKQSRWVIPVVLNFPTGDGGEIGQLAYDGKDFELLTDRATMTARACDLEANPEFQRQWNERFASPLQAGKT